MAIFRYFSNLRLIFFFSNDIKARANILSSHWLVLLNVLILFIVENELLSVEGLVIKSKTYTLDILKFEGCAAMDRTRLVHK